MRLKSVYVTDGVKKITRRGKPVAGNSAQPGDEFDTDEKTGNRLLSEGAAVGIKTDADNTDPSPGPKITSLEGAADNIPDISSVASPDNVSDLGLGDDADPMID